MNTVTINDLYFNRTILIIVGVYPNLSTNTPSFLLKDFNTGKVLNIDEVNWKDNSFSIRINTMSLENEYPITSGEYKLLLNDSGNYYPAKVSNNVKQLIDTESQLINTAEQEEPKSSDINNSNSNICPAKSCNLRIDRRSGNHWHGLSKYEYSTDDYYLWVDFFFKKKQRKKSFSFKKIRPKKMLPKFRNSLFISLFNHYNNKPKKGNVVLFTSDRTSSISGNEKCVYDRMIERGFDKNYKFEFEFKDGVKSRRSFTEKIRFTKKIAKADYIFVDDYQPELYKVDFSPETKIIQLWHACGAFKTIGFERINGKGAPSLKTRVHKCYTHVIVSSDHSADHNAEAFAIKRSKVYPVGIARTDVFFDKDHIQNTKARIMNDHPALSKASNVILYAPTFRGIRAKDAHFPFEKMDLNRIGEYCKNNNSVFLIKMHPFVKESFCIPDNYSDFIFDFTSYSDINELLMAADIVITDYSSLIYEAGLLKMPMLFYAFDYEDYDNDRGFYEPYEDIVPGKIVSTMDELIQALTNKDFEKEKLEGFLKKNFKYLDGKSTDRTIDLIFPRS